MGFVKLIHRLLGREQEQSDNLSTEGTQDKSNIQNILTKLDVQGDVLRVSFSTTDGTTEDKPRDIDLTDSCIKSTLVAILKKFSGARTTYQVNKPFYAPFASSSDELQDKLVNLGLLAYDMPADLSCLTVPELKQILVDHKITPKGRKKDLIGLLDGVLTSEEIQEYTKAEARLKVTDKGQQLIDEDKADFISTESTVMQALLDRDVERAVDVVETYRSMHSSLIRTSGIINIPTPREKRLDICKFYLCYPYPDLRNAQEFKKLYGAALAMFELMDVNYRMWDADYFETFTSELPDCPDIPDPEDYTIMMHRRCSAACQALDYKRKGYTKLKLSCGNCSKCGLSGAVYPINNPPLLPLMYECQAYYSIEN